LELTAKEFGITSRRLPAFYISQGGGPWPWMKGPMADAHERLAFSLRQIPQLVGATPTAGLMISAHWKEPDFLLMTHEDPPILYDYSGFPEHTYRVKYPAPGAPKLAERVRALLQAAGISVRLDSARGFDHGAFVPLMLVETSTRHPASRACG
jgi:aromatic ring-opening dioxygenase catalytic subunit (LigB family)